MLLLTSATSVSHLAAGESNRPALSLRENRMRARAAIAARAAPDAPFAARADERDPAPGPILKPSSYNTPGRAATWLLLALGTHVPAPLVI